MDYSIKKAVLTFSSDIYFWQRDAEKLRGFFTKLYTDENFFSFGLVLVDVNEFNMPCGLV